MKKQVGFILAALMVLGFMTACSSDHGNTGSSQVTINISKAETASLNRKAAPAVTSVVITISAPDMPFLWTEFPLTPPATITANYDVPNGTGRNILVEAKDGTGAVVYSDSVTLDLDGTPVAPLIALKPRFFPGTRQVGTADLDVGKAVARDSQGNIVIVGFTYGDLFSTNTDTKHNTADIFIIKTDKFSNVLWARQIGTDKDDAAFGVAVDKNDNSIIVTGLTNGGLNNETPIKHADCFVMKLAATGETLWTKIIGSDGDDIGNSIAIDNNGNAYVTGFTTGSILGPSYGGYDLFVAAFTPTGTLMRNYQYGTTGDESGEAIALVTAATGSVSVYVTGSTYGDFGGVNAGLTDLFVMKLDPEVMSTPVWVRQTGTPFEDQVKAITTDGAGAVYVAGLTYGGLDGNTNADTTGATSDVFILKYDANGQKQGTAVQLGSSNSDGANAIAVDANGAIIVAGFTSGAIGNNVSAGNDDIFVAKYDPATPAWAWIKQTGTTGYEQASGIAVDPQGNVIMTGDTTGGLDGNTNAGLSDLFLMMYDSAGVRQ